MVELVIVTYIHYYLDSASRAILPPEEKNVTLSIPTGFDFTNPDVFEKRVPHEEWKAARQSEPIHWVAKEPGIDGFDDDGYWFASKHADVKEISRRTGEVFTTYTDTAIPRFSPGIERGVVEGMRGMLINQDGPSHKKLRRIISRGFTPRAVEGLRAELADRARRIVDEAKSDNATEFVEAVASELPLQAIAELLGVPQEDRHRIFQWSNQMTGYDRPGKMDEATNAFMEILGYANAMAEERVANPQDDIVTKLVQADIDGEALTSDEFGWFVVILAVAGNETTRNATTLGMMALLDNPEQWELYKKERPETAYDEILRWASPVAQFQRTALEDVEINGQLIKEGQRVVICYGSGNFDEDVFDDPFTFDITRDPNPHLTFGGQGPHYCIGANLAKLQIELIFNAIADVLPDLKSDGEARRLYSGWLNGITDWKVSL